MESLPIEVVELICTFMSIRDLVAFSKTSSAYRDAARFIMLNDEEASLDVSMCILNHYNISFLIPIAIRRNLSTQFYTLANRIQPVNTWLDHIVITDDMRAIGREALVRFAGSISASFKKRMEQTLSGLTHPPDSREVTLRDFVQHEYYQWMSDIRGKRRKLLNI